MKGKDRWTSLVLVATLAAACALPTPEPAFWMEPCPNLSFETPPPERVEALMQTPIIPVDIPVEIGDFIVRVGNLRWTYEYFDPYNGKPVRSECPWLSYEWESRRKRDEGTRVFTNPQMPIFGSVIHPAWLGTALYLGIGGYLEGTPIEYERWDPNPEREGEEGEGYRCHCLVHVRPEWGPQWLVIQAVREREVGDVSSVRIPLTHKGPIARVEVPPPLPAPKR